MDDDAEQIRNEIIDNDAGEDTRRIVRVLRAFLGPRTQNPNAERALVSLAQFLVILLVPSVILLFVYNVYTGPVVAFANLVFGWVAIPWRYVIAVALVLIASVALGWIAKPDVVKWLVGGLVHSLGARHHRQEKYAGNVVRRRPVTVTSCALVAMVIVSGVGLGLTRGWIHLPMSSSATSDHSADRATPSHRARVAPVELAGDVTHASGAVLSSDPFMLGSNPDCSKCGLAVPSPATHAARVTITAAVVALNGSSPVGGVFCSIPAHPSDRGKPLLPIATYSGVTGQGGTITWTVSLSGVQPKVYDLTISCYNDSGKAQFGEREVDVTN